MIQQLNRAQPLKKPKQIWCIDRDMAFETVCDIQAIRHQQSYEQNCEGEIGDDTLNNRGVGTDDIQGNRNISRKRERANPTGKTKAEVTALPPLCIYSSKFSILDVVV